MVSLVCLQVVTFFLLKLLLLQANASVNDTDHFALLKFKEGITNDPYGVLHSWNDSIPFCNWFGITCTRHHQRVTSLVLSGKNLFGSISPYIGNLTYLRFIRLQDNNFHGTIPQVGRLFRLQQFILYNNTIEGAIPGTFANCSFLRTIWLTRNIVTGRIPVELGSLPNLQVLKLARNSLAGGIPTTFCNISTLIVFDVSSNNIGGSIPEEMGRLTNLSTLYIGTNNFSGEIPASIFNITSLQHILTVGNRLHGTLPDNMGLTLPNLRQFEIGINQYSGPIPTSISNASMLEALDLGQNKFIGNVPANLGKLQRLVFLQLSVNNLGSNSTDGLAFLTSLTNCSNLQVLAVGKNFFRGTLPSSIANMTTQLIYFTVGSNILSGTIPAGLDNLVNLFSLGMGDNLFTGSIPSYFGKFQHLQALNLYRNRFSSQIPSSLGNLTQLVGLDLSGNELEGSIPSSIGNCKMLSYVDLSKNNLTGEIPPQILLLPSLSRALSVAENMLVGNLPPEVGELRNLNQLSVAENNLSGKIPESIGKCTNLEYLYLSGNSFEGTIPSSLVFLRGLQFLDLSRNNLSGLILEDLQDLPFLVYLNMSFNHLEGEVPTRGVFKNASAVSLNGNNKLCGGVPELHLPKCPFKTIPKGKPSNSKLAIIVVCVVIPILLMSTFLYLHCKRSYKRKSLPSIMTGEHLIKVSYGDLARATNGFSPNNLIGSGGFGSVYRGYLVQIEKPIAVKVLNLEKNGATKSFKAECRALRNIRHRNLVKILTYCSSIDYKGNEFKALVYEFMENGNLEKWLHSSFVSRENSNSLSILQRLKVAIDVANSLHYLHDLCEIPIIHCDLKPSNVLLNDEMVAHLSDFGLARLFPTSYDSSQSQTSTIGIKGTVGYAAPEYGIAAAASKEGDVYSYGILVLEIFTGRQPTNEIFKDGLNLHDFVKAALPTRLLRIIDPSLLPRDGAIEATVEPDDGNGRVEEEEINNENYRQMTTKMHKCLVSVLEIGLACSVESPQDRMNMTDATRKLHMIKADFLEDLEQECNIIDGNAGGHIIQSKSGCRSNHSSITWPCHHE